MKRRKLTRAAYNAVCAAIRLRRSLRSKELAKRFGVSRSLIQAIAAGRRTGMHG